MFELEKKIIRELAEKCLNEDGFEAVELLLLNNRISGAKAYILGAIDSLWTKKIISDDEASQAYKLLDVDPIVASEFRQSSQRWK